MFKQNRFIEIDKDDSFNIFTIIDWFLFKGN